MTTLAIKSTKPAFRRGFRQGLSGVMMFSRGVSYAHSRGIDSSIKRAWTSVGDALREAERIERSELDQAPIKTTV